MVLLFGGGGLLAAEVGRVSLERTLSQFLQAPVRVQRIQVSLHRLTLHQISIAGSHSPLRIERLQIQAPLSAFLTGRWDVARMESVTLTGMTVSVGGVPLQAQGRLFLKGEKDSDRRFDGWLTLRHPFLNGLVEVSGPVNRPALVGWVEGRQGGRRHFAAQLEIDANSLRLVRLELPEGQIFQDLTVAWEKRSRSEMNFTARFLADRVSAEGRLGLRSPHSMDLFLDFKDAPVSEIASWILPPNKMPRLAGLVRGRVVLKGSLKQVLSRGELLSSEGRFNREVIHGMTLRFQGSGPILQVQNSKLSKPEGILLMEGTLDLRRLGQPDFFSGIHLLPMERTVHLAAQGQMGVGLAYEVD